MAGPLSEFYSGPMLAPGRVGNTLVQAPVYSQPSSIAQMYAGIYSDAGRADPVGSGLSASGGWNQFDDQFNPSTPAPSRTMVASAVPHANGTVAAGKSEERLPSGNVLAFGASAGPRSPAVSAINNATTPRLDPVGAGPMWSGIADMFGGYLSGDPGQTDWNTANQGGAGLRGPVDAPYAGEANPLPASPVAKMFAPQAAAPAPALNVTDNINRYLSQQGQSTAGMTAGEQQNALNKAMGRPGP